MMGIHNPPKNKKPRGLVGLGAENETEVVMREVRTYGDNRSGCDSYSDYGQLTRTSVVSQ